MQLSNFKKLADAILVTHNLVKISESFPRILDMITNRSVSRVTLMTNPVGPIRAVKVSLLLVEPGRVLEGRDAILAVIVYRDTVLLLKPRYLAIQL